jgi:hypothetical protein
MTCGTRIRSSESVSRWPAAQQRAVMRFPTGGRRPGAGLVLRAHAGRAPDWLPNPLSRSESEMSDAARLLAETVWSILLDEQRLLVRRDRLDHGGRSQNGIERPSCGVPARPWRTFPSGTQCRIAAIRYRSHRVVWCCLEGISPRWQVASAFGSAPGRRAPLALALAHASICHEDLVEYSLRALCPAFFDR